MSPNSDRRPLVWALTPYLLRDSRLIGESYDNEQTKAEVARAFCSIGLPWIWQPVVPHSIGDLIAQIAKCRETSDALVFNFCDGDDVNGYPGVSLLKALEAAANSVHRRRFRVLRDIDIQGIH